VTRNDVTWFGMELYLNDDMTRFIASGYYMVYVYNYSGSGWTQGTTISTTGPSCVSPNGNYIVTTEMDYIDNYYPVKKTLKLYEYNSTIDNYEELSPNRVDDATYPNPYLTSRITEYTTAFAISLTNDARLIYTNENDRRELFQMYVLDYGLSANP
jgi:hypothetical protein